MPNYSIKKELKRAVYEGNVKEVDALVEAGANVNLIANRSRNTLLHLTGSAEITTHLLLHGAKVNTRNRYDDTALHYAIKLRKNVEVVKELLKHGADVNAVDRRGNTPLNLAVKRRYIEHEVIKELLKYGPDINIRNRDHSSSLDNAVGVLPRAKLLIKFTLINNFYEDYKKVIDLNPYKTVSDYSELSRYKNACFCEILQMKTDKIRDYPSLYELVTSSLDSHILCSNQLSLYLTYNDYSARYPIYNDIILDKIKPFLERANSLNKLNNLEVYSKVNVLNQYVKGKKVVLDFDSTYNITKYLSNDDLLNFILAFDHSYEHATQSIISQPNLEEPEIKFHRTYSSIKAKRARLE